MSRPKASSMLSPLDRRLKRDEGRRRAALHFAEDFVMTLQDKGDGLYVTNANLLQALARKSFGHPFNESMIGGLIIFFRSARLCKDNQYIFLLASFVCDLLDDRLDIRR